MNPEHDPYVALGSDEERTLPKQPKKPIVANPSTPGVQTPNKPDGRDAPPAQTQTRDAVELEELVDVLRARTHEPEEPNPDEPYGREEIDNLPHRVAHRADCPTGEAFQAFAAGVEDMNVQAERRDQGERRSYRMRDAIWHAKHRPVRRASTTSATGPTTVARPRERRATSRRTTRAGPDDDPSPRPPLSAAERDYLRAEIDRRRRAKLERQRERDRLLFADEARR